MKETGVVLLGSLNILCLSDGRRTLGRSRRWRVNNLKLVLEEIGCDGMDKIGLAQGKDKWRAVLKAVINHRVP
jgi:hypothetical protein